MVDIVLHAGLSVLAVIAGHWLLPWPWAPWALAFLGSAIWVAREGWQNRGKWGNWFKSWSHQKKAEAIAPSVAGLVTALLVSLVS